MLVYSTVIISVPKISMTSNTSIEYRLKSDLKTLSDSFTKATFLILTGKDALTINILAVNTHLTSDRM